MSGRARWSIPDKPRDRPTAADVSALIGAVYARRDGGAGCCMHSVTDDGNIGDRTIASSLEDARDVGHVDCATALEGLAAVTSTQRRKAIAMRWRKR